MTENALLQCLVVCRYSDYGYQRKIKQDGELPRARMMYAGAKGNKLTLMVLFEKNQRDRKTVSRDRKYVRKAGNRR